MVTRLYGHPVYTHLNLVPFQLQTSLLWRQSKSGWHPRNTPKKSLKSRMSCNWFVKLPWIPLPAVIYLILPKYDKFLKPLILHCKEGKPFPTLWIGQSGVKIKNKIDKKWQGWVRPDVTYLFSTVGQHNNMKKSRLTWPPFMSQECAQTKEQITSLGQRCLTINQEDMTVMSITSSGWDFL